MATGTLSVTILHLVRPARCVLTLDA